MAQIKGQTGNPNGRPKGAPNKATKQFREILGVALDEMVGTIPELIAQIEDPKDRIDAMAKLMPYAYPKLQTVNLNDSRDKENEDREMRWQKEPTQ